MPTKKETPTKTSPEKSGAVPHPRGKRYGDLAAKVDRTQEYGAEEAVKLVKETGQVGFDATVEIHMRTGLDPKTAEQNIRGIVKLPAGTGKQRKVLAFVPGPKQAAVKKAGADFVSDEPTLEKVKGGWTGFDVAIATPDQMPEVAKLGQILGPKGLMPNPKAGTVTDKPEEALSEVKKGSIEYRLAKDSTLHAGIGKVSFKEEDLLANLLSYFKAVQGARPDDFKGTYVHSVTLASSMGPGIRVSQESLRKALKESEK